VAFRRLDVLHRVGEELATLAAGLLHDPLNRVFVQNRSAEPSLELTQFLGGHKLPV
jgi:hypothetical protein